MEKAISSIEYISDLRELSDRLWECNSNDIPARLEYHSRAELPYVLGNLEDRERSDAFDGNKEVMLRYKINFDEMKGFDFKRLDKLIIARFKYLSYKNMIAECGLCHVPKLYQKNNNAIIIIRDNKLQNIVNLFGKNNLYNIVENNKIIILEVPSDNYPFYDYDLYEIKITNIIRILRNNKIKATSSKNKIKKYFLNHNIKLI